jgi:hypothetical protein
MLVVSELLGVPQPIEKSRDDRLEALAKRVQEAAR